VDEAQRLAQLQALAVLDTAAEPLFDSLARMAALICGVPVALISLVDTERQWFKANVGLPGVTETSRDIAFCAHAILDEGVMEVPDAALDPRFADNPLVRDQPAIRFYAGAPITLSGGARVGTLCTIDHRPHALTAAQREQLVTLAAAAAQALEMRASTLQAALAAKSRLESLQADASARLRQILENLPVGIGHFGPDLRCRFTNAVASAWFGRPPESLLGMWLGDLIGAQAWQRNQRLFEAALAGQPQHYVSWIESPGAVRRELAIDLVPEHTPDGEPNGFLVMLTNTTAERIRRAAEARLAAIVENSDDAIVGVSLDERVTAWNRGAEQLLGYRADEIVGQPAGMLIPEALKAEASARRAGVQQGEGAARWESLRLRRDGSLVEVELTLSPLRDADGVVNGFSKLIRDISRRRLAERQLADSEARYRALIEVQTDMISLAGPDGSLTFVNEAYASHFGTHPADMVGRSLFDYVAAAERPMVAAHLKAVCEGRAVSQGENQMIRADGQLRWVSWTNRALIDSNGQVSSIHSVGRDVTDRKQVELRLRDSEAFLDRTGRVAGVGGWEIDLPSGKLAWSAQTRRMHEVEPDFVPTVETAIQFYAPEARPVIKAAVNRVIGGGPGWDLELPLITAMGRPIWARATGEADTQDGVVVRIFGAFQDITERKRIERELAEKHELLRVTLKSIGDAVITTDAAGCVQWMNPVAERMTGWLVHEAHGKPLTQVFHIVHELTRLTAESPAIRCLSEGVNSGLAHHTLLISREGREYGIEDSAAPIRDGAGTLLGVVLVFHDVSEQRRISNEMSFRASHDELTGLVNRAEFEARLERMLRRSKEDHSTNAMMFIDLDQFKLVNDACGHAMGDKLLCQVSRMLEANVRARDTLARLGGDEFGIIMEHCSVEQAQRAAQQICDQMEEFRFLHDARRFRIGTSIGLVPVDARWSGISPALQAADTACYAAKEAGRNRVHVWFDTDQALRARRGETQWASRLAQALDEDGFVLYGQRIVPVGAAAPNRQIVGRQDGRHEGVHLEVLTRLRDADGGIIPPGAFLPAAERFHMASRIDRWVLRRVFSWLADGGEALAAVHTVAINLSGQSIGDRAFHRYVVELLAHTKVDARKLCFEITETAAITNLADATAFIAEVRSLGVRMSLDDFGAGASSFGYLKALTVDYLKIDGQFIRDLIADPLDRAAVRCFHDVARVIGVKTIAEFVEHQAALDVLREIGVDYAQGYLIHRPEPLEDLVASLSPGVSVS
jgi:diguanylate cyclase (GGDEF)-like protein/PAS domain S-box-containing protein